MRRGTTALLVLAASILLAAGVAGCSRDREASTSAADGEPQRGGTLRIETEAFAWLGNFDPTGEYLTAYFGIYRNLLGRTLMGYRHVAGGEGNELIPDLAAAEPEISEDGRTYTFTIRDGVRFSPPVDREVTSQDVLYAFERIGTERLGAQYGFYYEGVIEGLTEFKEAGGLTKEGNEISGIETPDERTIVFRLEKPAGDFPHMLALPAAGPIPEEVARCFTRAGEYGRFVISSGPYMIEGSDDLDLSSCRAMKPLSGFDPDERLVLERNPNYDPETDREEARESFFDRWEMRVNADVREIFDGVRNGRVDLAYAEEPPDVLREYTTDDDLRERYKQGAVGVVAYVTMNLTQPPFDDVHVRKAMNWAMDKEALRRAWGGEVEGDIHHHVVPDTVFGDELSDYDPYPTDGDAGDLEKAKDEMRQSKYDTNQDGLCDAPQCKNVLHVTRNTDVWLEMQPVVEDAAREIGIELATREFEDSYAVIQTVAREVAISTTPAWGKDYPDASTFMTLFDGRSIQAEGNLNYSLVGLTPEQAQRLGVDFPSDGVPSVDEEIDRCSELRGDERRQCWIDLDRKLMEEVVPWVPYLDQLSGFVIGEAVTKWEYDQSSGEPAWAHIAVDPENE